MTAQINDSFLYENNNYSICAVQNDLLFDPKDIGLNPVMLNTACYRGFYVVYCIKNEKLLLKKLNIGLESNEPKIVNNIKPEKLEYGEWCYTDINIDIHYTGGIIIGRNFIRELYIHMGFQSPYKYKIVKEVILEKGNLINIQDHSNKMENIRKKLKDLKSQNGIELDENWIGDSFSLAYNKKWFL